MRARILRFTALSLLLVVTAAFGFDPKGKYSYSHKGYSGDMMVSEGEVDRSDIGALTSVRPLKVPIRTVSLSQAHICEIEATENTASRVGSESSLSTPFLGSDEAKFSVDFTSKGATVEVNDRGLSCGLNGDFGGKWVKVSSKKAKPLN
jgi:hypothetical protein